MGIKLARLIQIVYIHFYPLEIVGVGSETQLQVDKNSILLPVQELTHILSNHVLFLYSLDIINKPNERKPIMLLK